MTPLIRSIKHVFVIYGLIKKNMKYLFTNILYDNIFSISKYIIINVFSTARNCLSARQTVV